MNLDRPSLEVRQHRQRRLVALLARGALRAAAAGDQVEAEEPSADDRDEVTLRSAKCVEPRDGEEAR
jgi:hypothetical protein